QPLEQSSSRRLFLRTIKCLFTILYGKTNPKVEPHDCLRYSLQRLTSGISLSSDKHSVHKSYNMGRSQNSFIKNQKVKKKLQKKKEKEEKKQERKENNLKGGALDDMIAYVDEFGNIVDEKPEEPIPPKKK
ncbi:MAG: hypothetical protein ACJA0X_002661, partial [Cyclobacteriaceae bacterium]